jgi:predicted GIY-YIG superfamily endonuclease
MPKLFLTKVWGFDPEIYPALGFNSDGARRNFLRASSPGDWIIFAGTLGQETNVDDQGRLLGKVQLGPDEIDVEETLRSVGYNIPKNQYNSDGKYKWPFGLPIISALRFPNKPTLLSVLGNNLSGSQWAAFALDVREKLGDEAQAKLEALPGEIAQMVEAPAIIRQLARQRVFLLNRGVTGPGPSGTRAGFTRILGEGSAYLLELQGKGARDIFKIGFSKDVDVRLEAHNKPLLSSVTEYTWKLVYNLKFPSEQQAYNFEQIVHRRLKQHLVDEQSEIYRIAKKEIDRVWQDVLYRADWAISHLETTSSSDHFGKYRTWLNTLL